MENTSICNNALHHPINCDLPHFRKKLMELKMASWMWQCQQCAHSLKVLHSLWLLLPSLTSGWDFFTSQSYKNKTSHCTKCKTVANRIFAKQAISHKGETCYLWTPPKSLWTTFKDVVTNGVWRNRNNSRSPTPSPLFQKTMTVSTCQCHDIIGLVCVGWTGLIREKHPKYWQN